MAATTRVLVLLALGGAAAACDKNPTLAGPPAQMAVLSGNDQQGTVGQELPQPLVVKVVDDDGRPVAGQLVNFRVVSGGGSLAAGAVLTSAEGIARDRWTLGTVADSQRVEVHAADAAGAPLPAATFRALARAGAAAGITPVQAQVSGQPGAAVDSVAALVKDQFGNPVAGATITWTVTGGGGSVSPATSTTNAQGVARARWTLGPTLAAQTLQASAGAAITAVFTGSAALGAGATLAIVSGNNQTGAVTTELPAPLVVEVRQNGVPVQGVQVVWSTPRPEYGVVTSPSVTDAQGRASARWTLGTLAGTQVAQAQVPDVGMTVGFDGNVTAGAPSRLYVVPGDVGYVAQAGDVIDVRYTVADQYGNRVPGATVTVAPSHGSASPTTGQTDADGYLHVAWTLAPIHLEGANFVRAVMTATSPGTQADARTPLATSVTVRHGPVATIVIIPDERTAAADQPVTFFLGLRDAYGNRFSLDEFAGCTIQWSAPPPAQLTPGRGSLAQQLEIRSTSSVTVAATCGSASDTAELIIQ